MREKSQVEDIDRSIYDIRDEEKDAYRMKEGLTPQIVEQLSKEKGDPAWMQQFRLESLQIYNEMPVPDWGPSIEGLDMDHIATYVRPHSKMQASWKDVPEDIKETFERLGIPQAERKSLAGVGAQYDSELVYHNVKDEVAAQGVVYTDMESALKGEYADMVHKYFMKLVTPHDHKFAALHGAVWSGGSFVYVPKGVHVSIPLQSYFRLNAKGAGQFEHTLIIVDEGASLHFIAVMFVSSEMPEVMGIADRIIVMCDGRITGELSARETTQNEILTYATRFENKFAQDEGSAKA